MSAISKLRRRLRRRVARDEQLTPGQEQAFLRLMKVAGPVPDIAGVKADREKLVAEFGFDAMAGISDEQIAQMRLLHPKTEVANG